ncbi:MAG TPA: malto-oligosyltrehalose trehalohydrolase [Candidatus Sulfotelmatobacter sp.]
MQGSLRNKTLLGATRLADSDWQFLVWAPNSRTVEVNFVDRKRRIEMEPLERGYFRATVEDLEPNARYLYRLEDGRELPDPASRFQPEGVHGPSQGFDTGAFEWTDHSWRGRPLEGSVFYELHVGTYTREGTFEGLIPHLPYLVDLGITTIELMPIAQFPGSRNWGYDGVYEFAPQNSYCGPQALGGPHALQKFVDEAHAHGLAVALDVVYNHLGPEGNYLNAYGAYFTDLYRTPWGQALNFDGAGSDEVRRFFIENALYWLEDYHVDALRLDAIHGIFDFGARHFLAELKAAVSDLSKRLGRRLHLIAESDLNDARVLHGPERGGYGIDAQWSDDFHHSVHSLLTRERTGYYLDFGGIDPLIMTLRDGWFYSGQYSRHRERHYGNSPCGIAPSRFVVCDQNHDQVGNRAAGERLSSLVSFEAAKLAAGITLLSPFTPLLFMGEEYGETAPFQYFTSHGDPGLIEAVRKGRREEFAAFGWEEGVPDPQDEKTFCRSKLDHSLTAVEPHRTMLGFYRELIQIRKRYDLGGDATQTVKLLNESGVLLWRETDEQVAMLFNFGAAEMVVKLPELAGAWSTVIRSSDQKWRGPKADSPPETTIPAAGEVRLPALSLLMLSRAGAAGKSA